MTLDEAIIHAEEKAKCGGRCGEEHAQLAEWLKELQKMRAAQPDSKESSSTHKALDTISRQVAIETAIKMFEVWYGGSVLRDREIRARFEALPAGEPGIDEWCTDCSEYDHERHCCPRWNRVIRETLKDAQQERKTGRWTQISPAGIYECSECAQMVMTKDIGCYRYCPNCGSFNVGVEDG